MKRKFSFFLTLLTAIVCVFSVAACGSKTPAEGGGEEPPAEEGIRIVLVYNNGQPNGYLYAEEGTPAARPDDPAFEPHIFLGWYLSGKLYDWDSAVTEQITLQALWEKQYTGTLSVRNGDWATIDGARNSSRPNSLLSNETDGFDRGTIEVTVTSPTASDSGIILCLTGNASGRYWESDVSYYCFLISLDGSAYLGKVDYGNWTALKVLPIQGYKVGQSYRLKTVLDGTDIYCYVNGKLYIAFSERNFLTGTGYGIRTSATDVMFSDFSVTGKCLHNL